MARLWNRLQRGCRCALQIRDIVHTPDLAAPRGVLPLPACVAQMCPLQILEQKDSVFTLPGLKTEVGVQAPGTGLCARFHLKFLDCRASLWESGRKAHTLPPPPGPAALCSSMPPATLCGSVEPGSVIPCVCASQLLVVSGAPRPLRTRKGKPRVSGVWRGGGPFGGAVFVGQLGDTRL